ncbi:MAG: pyridoxal phosphate-dependent aminotransferase [Candidatus Paceibacterota bacterium]|jgi:aspartate/methionine/tyrosine aminotransferase
MRNNIVHPGADELTYEIREIVDFGNELEKQGVKMVWENIGDPVAKGEKLPPWMRGIIKRIMDEDDKVFGYSPTSGLLETRIFLANQRKKETGIDITPDDILFFNGLGDAISKVYTYLNGHTRVIGPSPAYPTHSSAEAAHSGSHHITYELNPRRNWLPDLEELRNKVKFNPNISGILIINPDNPTGMIYPKRVLEEIVSIAREFDLFIVCDEIYSNLHYGGEKMVPLASVIGEVPAIVMRGLSKEVPWPGARCGWIEMYNKDRDPFFARYTKTLLDAKRLEVCSTTLPQRALPLIFSHPEFGGYVAGRNSNYEKRANIAYDIFRSVSGIIAPKPAGAFYMTVVFEDGALNGRQTLQIPEDKVRETVLGKTNKLDGKGFDKRFAYYLMGATGICVVPLSGFNSELPGFRLTLLEPDEKVFEDTMKIIAKSIKEYLNSA